MAATYPLAVKTFTQKRNLLDDVEASHINDIQSEIVAIENALGTSPAKDKVTGVSYPTVDSRISAVRGGNHTNAFYLQHTNDSSTFTASTTTDYIIPLGGKWFDYANMSNGTGLTIKETGLYQINAGLNWNSVPIRGSRHLKVLRYPGGGSQYSVFMTDTFVVQVKDGRWTNGRTNASILYPLNKGDKVSLACRLENDTPDTGKFTVTYGRLNGYKVRDF
jgi:hypothetical protein